MQYFHKSHISENGSVNRNLRSTTATSTKTYIVGEVLHWSLTLEISVSGWYSGQTYFSIPAAVFAVGCSI